MQRTARCMDWMMQAMHSKSITTGSGVPRLEDVDARLSRLANEGALFVNVNLSFCSITLRAVYSITVCYILLFVILNSPLLILKRQFPTRYFNSGISIVKFILL